jgi:hypothetical protein
MVLCSSAPNAKVLEQKCAFACAQWGTAAKTRHQRLGRRRRSFNADYSIFRAAASAGESRCVSSSNANVLEQKSAFAYVQWGTAAKTRHQRLGRRRWSFNADHSIYRSAVSAGESRCVLHVTTINVLHRTALRPAPKLSGSGGPPDCRRVESCLLPRQSCVSSGMGSMIGLRRCNLGTRMSRNGSRVGSRRRPGFE